MRISIELVPRSHEHLQAELQLIRSSFPSINTVNIPDLMRLEMRSWEGSALSKAYYEHCIPHVRAIDFSMKESFALAQYLHEHRIDEILVVTGDHPQGLSRTIYPTAASDFIRKIKEECPGIKLYAALDPYRASMRQEYEYIQRKRESGADGFFTQPFFDLRFMEMYAELLQGLDIFWGVSPVTSERSKSYWETKNQAIFPADFQPTLEWNTRFAKRVLDFSTATNSSLYFMPIKTDLKAYLDGIFG